MILEFSSARHQGQEEFLNVALALIAVDASFSKFEEVQWWALVMLFQKPNIIQNKLTQIKELPLYAFSWYRSFRYRGSPRWNLRNIKVILLIRKKVIIYC